MGTPAYNYLWPQGSDLVVSFIYKEGLVDEEAPVDLTGYALRMDLVTSDGTVAYVFNTDEEPDPEVTLGTDGRINIIVPRAATLPEGSVYEFLVATDPIETFYYDIFLRDTADLQKKILRGVISIERSYTLWE